jgi:ubiquinone/menaquinone biosynthesis C-methylase UbiE
MARLSTAEANRLFYAQVADTYHQTEECVVSARLRRSLREALEHAVAQLPPAPRVLDACGGSGNVSLPLLELGARPTTVDISPEMLSIYDREARRRGFGPDLCVGEIGDYLRENERTWDMIVFSSALHHLENYEEVIDLALDRLSPGGILLTIFDPTLTGRLGRWLRRFDYLLHVVLRTPSRIPSSVMRRLFPSAPSVGETIGALAERHALQGVDDLALRQLFEARGLEVLVHDRLHEGRFLITRAASQLLREPSAFRFVVRRPA